MAPFVLKDSHYDTEYFVAAAVPINPLGGGGPVTAIAQTFIAGSNYDLTRVTLRLQLSNLGRTDIGLIEVGIYSVDGNSFPVGSALSSGQTDGDAITTSANGEDVNIVMPAVSLTSGTTYAIVINTPEALADNTFEQLKTLGSFDEIDGGYSNGTSQQFENEIWEERIVDIGGTPFLSDWYFKTWKEGDFRQVDTPTPADTDTGISVTPLLKWQINGTSDTEDNDFFFIYLNKTGLPFTDEDDLLVGWRTSLELQILFLSPPSIGVTYYWQVQAISENGDLLDSPVWSFTTSVINPPAPSGGANPNGLNNMITMQRLVAAAKDSIFYEDI